MRMREKILRRAAEVLPAGESPVAAFQAGKGPLPRLCFVYRVVVVSDRNIHVCSARWFTVCHPKRILFTVPPGTVIVPMPDLFHTRVDLGGERLWVTLAYRRELEAAIAASHALARGDRSMTAFG